MHFLRDNDITAKWCGTEHTGVYTLESGGKERGNTDMRVEKLYIVSLLLILQSSRASTLAVSGESDTFDDL